MIDDPSFLTKQKLAHQNDTAGWAWWYIPLIPALRRRKQVIFLSLRPLWSLHREFQDSQVSTQIQVRQNSHHRKGEVNTKSHPWPRSWLQLISAGRRKIKHSLMEWHWIYQPHYRKAPHSRIVGQHKMDPWLCMLFMLCFAGVFFCPLNILIFF